MNANTIPFTYSVFCVPTGQYYYGVRTVKSCHPDNLWTTYFTSSKFVKELIDKFGIAAFVVKVRKTFDSKEKALAHEERFLKRVKAAQSDKWINKSNGAKNFVCNGHTEESRKKMSVSTSGEKNPCFGKPGNMLGKKLSEEAKRKIAESNKRRTFKSGKENPTSKNYWVTYPNGKRELIIGMTSFCIENGLNNGCMSMVYNGKLKHHQGFRCEPYVENIEPINYGEFTGTYLKRNTKYLITHPDGKQEITNNLNVFCKKINLHSTGMYSVARKKSKSYHGFKCEYA